MIYKVGSVSLVGGSVEILDDSNLDGLGFGTLDDDGLGVFDGANTNRAPLAATFTDIATGEDFTVAVTHMKSKGGAGTGGNADANDGAGNYNEMRTEGVEVLKAWLDLVGDRDGIDEADPGDVLVLGDFNAYRMEDPVQAIVEAGFKDLTVSGSLQFEYSFVYRGEAGTLDYAFASPALVPAVRTARFLNINAAYPPGVDLEHPWLRSSDHDPVMVDLRFRQSVTAD